MEVDFSFSLQKSGRNDFVNVEGGSSNPALICSHPTFEVKKREQKMQFKASFQ